MSSAEERPIGRRRVLRWAFGAGLLLAFPPELLTGSPGALPPEEKPAPEKEAPEKEATEKQAAQKRLDSRKKRILFYTRSQGFEHSTVKRKGDELAFAEKVMVELGASRNFEVTATKDGRLFTEDNLTRYDAFFFYTTGDPTAEGGDHQPPMPREGKRALLEAIAAGKGFIGSHCANDTFHSPGEPFENQEDAKLDPYIRMIGGEFIRHGPQQTAAMRVASPRFPGCEGLGETFNLHEEWYSNKNFAPDIHVILVQETRGMQGSDYQRPPFPATWARRHEKGRVFYTSMGHREDVWTNPVFQKLLLGGIDWVLGRVEAELTPNLQAAAPEAVKMPPRPRKES